MPALNEKWRLQIETRRSSGTGGFHVVLTDGDLVWAEQPAKSDIDATLDDLSRRRDRQAAACVADLRWRSDVEPGDSIKETRSDRLWEILTVSEVGRRRFLDCLLEAI